MVLYMDYNGKRLWRVTRSAKIPVRYSAGHYIDIEEKGKISVEK